MGYATLSLKNEGVNISTRHEDLPPDTTRLQAAFHSVPESRRRTSVHVASYIDYDNIPTDALRSAAETLDIEQSRMNTHNVANFPGHGNAGFQLGNNQGTIENININCNKTDSDCLKALRLTDPRDDKKRIRDTKGGLLLDSSRWILKHQDFRRWHDEDQSRLLWIKGDPGKGKTMLMIGIAEELEQQLEQFRQPEPAMPPSAVLAYFFCQGSDSNLNNSTAILRGLTFLLAIQHQSLSKHLREEYDHSGSKLFEGPNAFFTLSRILGNMLQDPSLERAYLLIDALDECEAGLEQLLALIVEHSSASSVKWIVSSRNMPKIEELLEPADDKVRLSLELNHESIAAAVHVYISHEVTKLTRVKRYDSGTERAIREHLYSNADDTFLWVALVCDNLRKVPSWRARETVKQFPLGLGPLYERMMEQIGKEHPEDVNLCHRVLAAVALVYRPVTVDELGSLVELPNTISSYKGELINVIERCGSFLTVRDERVYIIHLSAKDYLEDKAAATIFPYGRSEVHRGMFMQSLCTMESVLHRDIYGLRILTSWVNEVKSPDPDPLATIRYSCLHWVDHFYDASHKADMIDVEPTLKFFEKHVLNWIEALSFLSSVGTGIVAAAKIWSMAEASTGDDDEQSQKQSKLVELAYDIWRFLRQFKPALEDHPLQVHVLAVIYTPTRSLIKQLSQEGEARWLSTRPLMQRHWSACLQTLEGYQGNVFSLAVSADSKRVASASSRGKVSVWDLATGKCVRVLQRSDTGEHSAWSVAFSPDDRWIVAGFGDGAVSMWDLATGKCSRFLKGLVWGIESVAFCHDAKQLVSVSRNATINMWDTATGECIQTQPGDGDFRTRIALSPDGKWLVSASKQSNTVQVKNLATGRNEWILTYPDEGDVASVALSPDNERVVVGFDNGIVQVWNVTTGRSQQILEGVGKCAMSVAFSPDGKKVVAGCDVVARVGDAINGGCLQTFKSVVGSINAVTFAGIEQAVTGSGSGDLQVWDITMRRRRHTLEGNIEDNRVQDEGDEVEVVAISLNGDRVASGSKNGTVSTWATNRGLKRLGGDLGIEGSDSDELCSVQFSPDGKQIVSVSHLGCIKSLDATTGRCLHTLKRSKYGRFPGIISTAFSPDGKQFMSVSRDGIIQVWDMATGRSLHMHNCGRDNISLGTFSPDGKLVALIFSHTVQVWDMATDSHRQTLKGISDGSQTEDSEVFSLSFSLDNARIATGHRGGIVRVWDTENGTCLQTLPCNLDYEHVEHSEDWVTKVVFSPNRNWVASTSSYSKQLQVRNIVTGESFLSTGHASDILSWDPAGLQTSSGIYNALPKDTVSGIGVDGGESWIMRNGEPYLWLPPDYRPAGFMAVSGGAIALCCESGEVHCFRLSSDD